MVILQVMNYNKARTMDQPSLWKITVFKILMLYNDKYCGLLLVENMEVPMLTNGNNTMSHVENQDTRTSNNQIK